jgi:hypothetical protein
MLRSQVNRSLSVHVRCVRIDGGQYTSAPNPSCNLQQKAHAFRLTVLGCDHKRRVPILCIGHVKHIGGIPERYALCHRW